MCTFMCTWSRTVGAHEGVVPNDLASRESGQATKKLLKEGRGGERRNESWQATWLLAAMFTITGVSASLFGVEGRRNGPGGRHDLRSHGERQE